MKRILVFLMIALGLTATGLAQDKLPSGRLEAYKIAYLTRKLNLSAQEAQKFWPIYNSYIKDIRQIKIHNRNLDEIDMEEKVINIRKRYRGEFTNVLPGERVNQFFKVDKEFNNYIRKELQDRKEINQLRQQNKRPYKQ